MPDKISFLGMGIMGSAMAANLLKAGHSVHVWNRNPNRPIMGELAASGAEVSATLADCVAEAAVIFTCLGDENDVFDRLAGDGDSIVRALADKNAGLRPVVVDFSTIGAATARKIALSLAGADIGFLDAPVTGGDIGAKNGTLTIMVGGEKADFDKVEPLLSAMGKNIRYCGPAGAGQVLKLCNQVLCAVNMIAVSEAFHLAEKLDLDPALIVDVLQTGAGGSWALANLGKRILQDDLAPAFSVRNMLKDLRLVFDALDDVDPLNAVQTPQLPGTALSVELFRAAVAGDDTLLDSFGTQAMIQAYRQKGQK